MLDDSRWGDDPLDRADSERGLDRGASNSRNRDRECSNPRDVFTKGLDLPRGRERRLVRERNRVYEINGEESRALATIGAFRVVAQSDLHDLRDDSQSSRRSLKHLESQGLIRSSPFSSDGRAVTLTDRGRDLLEANRQEHDDRSHEPRQAFYTGVRKPRELTHDTKVYRAYQRSDERLRGRGGQVRRVVLDYELKRDYQRFLHERNRGEKDCDGRPDREPEEIARWAREHELPYDDGHVRFPDGTRHRERYKAPVESKSGALRWGQDRERHLLQHGPEPAKKEVPTLEEFAPKFLEGYAKADRHKPSGVASKETILRIHLIPVLGEQKLDAISNAQVQRLKLHLKDRAAKTVNNVLTVLNVMLKTAVEWEMIDQLPCSIRLLPVARRDAAFHDFGAYERLLEAARSIDWRTYLIALLGGEGGLRVGEIVALGWADVDIERRQISIRHSDWRGQLTTPKNGRGRFVAMTERVATALRKYRHLRSSRVLCKDDGEPITRQGAWSRVRYAAQRANVPTGVHILRHTFCSHLVMRGAAMRSVQELVGHQDLTMTQRYSHLSPAALVDTVRLLETRAVDSERGEILETEKGRERKLTS